MDKRKLAVLFQQRLRLLFDRSQESQSAFADNVGIDRSALSQLLSGKTARLPRVETLLSIAERHQVSLDWLLGISQDEGLMGALLPSLEIETSDDEGAGLLIKWHAEATGSKIRYVPARIPDLLRTPEVIAYEASEAHQSAATQVAGTAFRLDYNREPGTDMESCMPLQTLEAFAAGQGIWQGLPKAARQGQLLHMADLIDDLYPSFRLFLFDGRARFSVPYTVFGSLRAAVFVGRMYLVLHNVDSVRMMQRHFDDLVRDTRIHAHEVAAYIRLLTVV
ncbi:MULTISPECIES: helix-turn-helix domain-containing protein [Rhizobium]|uniref:Helix-turn-helix transcriptional regulator n=1 Tax=Rhizobium rhododendri TaxID=2506430 RepID=A0ABY8IGK3_9HYPH|nr:MULTISPECIES: helix-turn-helix transcriptional regulator [Rhizobium]MBO9096812.1 helix-turn-helix transcriptional regulator [Rhizobium sp. L58/93]MBO9134315.1 helix-turn-helix transcriptional regulator [Rhizobium sp. B209b/85]MBO9167067.1 helix-turn-helix transcriptional regulator [Rhizobium sp. L245/93]MBO9183039.1 helix-turn-helix transcriptional regulator [Rhizobium sp. E27B/91]MBZ5762150.1 helix-turn-helix domain-containing protein [Rhizobium sp. VS19-DR96]